MKDFKQNIIRAIRDARFLPFNAKAQEHYIKQVDPEVFMAKIRSLQKVSLEVVS